MSTGDVFERCRLYTAVDDAKAMGLYPYFHPIEETEGTEVGIGGRRLLMFGSNNYLGLTVDPRVKEAAEAAVRRYGASCSGSRFLNGTLRLHLELEERLADFLKKEAALVFTTGFQANLGVTAGLLRRGDIAIMDVSNHASLYDGVRLSYATLKRFDHGDVADLDRVLGACEPGKPKAVLVDGLYSMEGDLAPLPQIVALKERYGARLVVDDAHGVGVMGEHGRGTAEHYGCEDGVDVVTATFSKSFGSLGGVVAGPREVVRFVQHHGRAMIFAASMTPAAVAATLKSLEIVQAEPERRRRVHANADYLRRALREMGYRVGEGGTPVIPVYIGDDVRCLAFWRGLFDNGLFANAVLPPAVAPGDALIRNSCMATHGRDQLDRALEIYRKVGRMAELIP